MGNWPGCTHSGQSLARLGFPFDILGLHVAEGLELGDTLGCLVREAPFTLLSLLQVPGGRKVAGACWEDITMRISSGNSPEACSWDPGGVQCSADLRDPEGRWPVSWEGGWPLAQQKQGWAGRRPGLPDRFAFCLVITHYLPSGPDKPLSWNYPLQAPASVMKSITVRQAPWLMGKTWQLPGAPGGARTDPLSVHYFSNRTS